MDWADDATASAEAAMDAELARRSAARAEELARRGSATCEKCKRPISKARRQAVPSAVLCVRCARGAT